MGYTGLMLRLFTGRKGPWLIAGVALCSLVGCDLAAGFLDIGDSLTNGDKALIDSPGRLVAAGKFHRLLVDGSLKDGGHVIALKETEEGNELAIIPYVNGDPCFIDPAVDVERLSSRIDVELPGIVSVQRDANNRRRGEVNFFDFKCREVIQALPNSNLPQVLFPNIDPDGLLALTDDGDLYVVKPERQELIRVAGGVTQARSHNDTLWSVENGELVIRDRNFKIMATLGSGVTEFVIAAGRTIAAAFVDESGLSIFNEVFDTTFISDNACSPVSWGTDTVAYFQPCEARRLRALVTGTRLGREEEVLTLIGPQNVVLHDRAQVVLSSQSTELILIQGDAGTDRGALVVSTLAKDAEAVDGVLRLDTRVLEESSSTLRWGVLLTNYDGVSGTLVQLKKEDGEVTEVREIAYGVAQLPGATINSGRGVLTDFDGVTGTLNILTVGTEKVTSFMLADKVPIQAQTVELDTGRTAFIADSDDGIVGSLYLTGGAQASTTQLRLPQKIGENVYLDSARFLEQPRGVAYLERRAGRDYPALKVWLTDSELTVEVNRSVSEYRTVPWPAPGILYAVPEGATPGLWFAKAR